LIFERTGGDYPRPERWNTVRRRRRGRLRSTLRGSQENGVAVFRGIPFAEPHMISVGTVSLGAMPVPSMPGL